MSDHWKYEPDFRFDPLFDAFEKANQQLYFVGGYVRDWQHHKFSTDPAITDPKSTFVVHSFEPKDIDFTTSALPEETIKILKKCKLPVFPIGIKFGTIGTIVDDMKVEITTFRVDEKYDRKTRKPEVRFGKSLQDDLKRRDFTINAMAMSRTGQLIDPFEGFSSLIQGLLMTPIEPKESFSDDPLRILRGFRFCSRFGLNWCGPDWEAAKECLPMLETVSSERIFEEMSKILMSPHVGDALKQMGELGLFKEVFPEIQQVIDFKQNQGKWHSKLVWPHTIQVVQQTPEQLNLRWAALFHDVAKPETYSEGPDGVHFLGHEYKGAKTWLKIANRFRMSSEFRDDVHFLILEHLTPGLLSESDVGDAGLRRFIARAGTQKKIDDLFLLSRADITSSNVKLVEQRLAKSDVLKKRVDEIIIKQGEVKLKLPKGLGFELMTKLEMKAGPELGRIMKKLEEMLVDGLVQSDADFVEVARKVMSDERVCEEISKEKEA